MSDDDVLDVAPGWRRTARAAGIAAALLLIVTAPWWGRAAMARMDFFRLEHVELHGARFVSPAEILQHMAVDTTMSVWMPLDPVEARIEEHVQVRSARIERRLPGTLVVHVTENPPLALVPGRGGFAVVDANGDTLPIEPSRTSVDLPIVPAGDTGVLRLLAELRAFRPALFERVSEVRAAGRDELVLRLDALAVRTMRDVSVDRMAELLLVEEDLARRQLRPVEIDLRYRDQVIARLP